MAPRVLTLLTDYGLDDSFVGTCRGVIRRIAPDADVIDITHGIAPQQVLQGALALADTLPYMPVGIHVAIVDPGVGGERRPVALRGGDGRLYVGPDNGLLLVAADRLGGVQQAVEVLNPDVMLQPVSPTFHGRDIFCPAAAHLAVGVPLRELGPALEPDTLVRLELPVARVEQGRVLATVLGVDRFGNVRLNVAGEDVERAGLAQGASIEIVVDARRYSGLVARTFVDVHPGGIVLYEDSSRSMTLAVNRGSAARTLFVVVGQEVSIGHEGR